MRDGNWDGWLRREKGREKKVRWSRIAETPLAIARRQSAEVRCKAPWQAEVQEDCDVV